MATSKDLELVEFLIRETEQGRLKWEVTAGEAEFSAAFRGKYVVKVYRIDYTDERFLVMVDQDSRELLRLRSGEVERVSALFEFVRRWAFGVDQAIDEIIGKQSA